jgi:hypothetical protein
VQFQRGSWEYLGPVRGPVRGPQPGSRSSVCSPVVSQKARNHRLHAAIPPEIQNTFVHRFSGIRPTLVHTTQRIARRSVQDRSACRPGTGQPRDRATTMRDRRNSREMESGIECGEWKACAMIPGPAHHKITDAQVEDAVTRTLEVFPRTPPTGAPARWPSVSRGDTGNDSVAAVCNERRAYRRSLFLCLLYLPTHCPCTIRLL